MIRAAAVLLLVLSTVARAEEDAASLYEVSTEGTTASFKAGQKGKVVIEIRARGGGYIKGETPLKIELAGKDVTLEKATLTYKDSVGKKKGDQQYPDPRFEVALSAAVPAKGQVEAKLSFFVCTDKLCARQSKNLLLPVEVQ